MLKYVGSGFLVGIPARDLTEQEVDELEGGQVWARLRGESAAARRLGLRRFLAQSGLYREAKVGERPSPPTPLPERERGEEKRERGREEGEGGREEGEGEEKMRVGGSEDK